jgi:hypothetical protein
LTITKGERSSSRLKLAEKCIEKPNIIKSPTDDECDESENQRSDASVATEVEDEEEKSRYDSEKGGEQGDNEDVRVPSFIEEVDDEKEFTESLRTLWDSGAFEDCPVDGGMPSSSQLTHHASIPSGRAYRSYPPSREELKAQTLNSWQGGLPLRRRSLATSYPRAVDWQENLYLDNEQQQRQQQHGQEEEQQWQWQQQQQWQWQQQQQQQCQQHYQQEQHLPEPSLRARWLAVFLYFTSLSVMLYMFVLLKDSLLSIIPLTLTQLHSWYTDLKSGVRYECVFGGSPLDLLECELKNVASRAFVYSSMQLVEFGSQVLQLRNLIHLWVLGCGAWGLIGRGVTVCWTAAAVGWRNHWRLCRQLGRHLADE